MPLVLLLLSGCSAQVETASAQIFAMDTIMTLSAQGEGSQAAIDEATALIYDLEDLLSVTDQGSDIWAINHAQGAWVAVDAQTYDLVVLALTLAEGTGGAIDPTIYPAMTAWGFTTGDYQVPSQEDLDGLLSLVDYTKIELDEATSSIRIPADMMLDLGSVAKGYASDLVADVLSDMDHAIVSLGGNAYVIGEKSDDSAWLVGIQSPNDDGYLAVISPEGGNAIVTSGGYQRYFEENGQTYWHILNPDTAAPAVTDLRSVTIIGTSGITCDGLSTALFVMGLEESIAFWQEWQSFDMVLMDADGTIYITEPLQESFSLANGATATVEVIAP